MPLFRKGATPSHDAPHGNGREEPAARVAFMHRFDDEVWRARRYGRPLGAVCLAPRLLAGEQLTAAEREAALDALAGSLRRCDITGEVGDAVFAAALPETGEAEARAVAYRLRSELSLRIVATGRINWQVGHAALTSEETADALLLTTLNAMRE